MELEEALKYSEKYEQFVHAAASIINDYLKFHKLNPLFGIVLGSGLGDVADAIEKKDDPLKYTDIPHFPQVTVDGHAGEMVIGTLEGVPVIGLKGRKHYYEVADNPLNTGILQAVFPVHVLADLGVRNYFATNAVGGLNLDYQVGDVMLAKSQISLFMPNPLLGKHREFKRVDNGKRVERFEPMIDAYDSDLRAMFVNENKEYKEIVHRGVLVGVTGPSYESEGDCMALRNYGADAVGMSVIPEVIVARNRGMKVISMSNITNVISAEGKNATNHEEVQRNADKSKQRLSSMVRNFFRAYREQYMEGMKAVENEKSHSTPPVLDSQEFDFRDQDH